MAEFKLPDFDEMLKLADDIGNLSKSIILLETSLDMILATITRVVTKNDVHYVAGKPPSMEYIKSNYHQLGYDQASQEAITTHRQQIADNKSQLEKNKMIFTVYREMIDVWKADKFNKREAEY